MDNQGQSQAEPRHPRRGVHLKRKPTLPDIAAGLVFVIAGAMFVASAHTSDDRGIRVDNTGGFRESIATRARQATELAAQVAALKTQVEQASIANGGSAGSELKSTRKKSTSLAPMVGLTELVGPGLRITLDDAVAPDVLPDGMTGDDYIVHQQDVQGVVNALWRGGASGVTVMGQRLIATSAVRCVGNTVILQGRVYSPPFEIKAIGDQVGMQRALEEDPSVQVYKQWGDVVGLGYEQTAFASETLPAYTGPLTPSHATTIK